MPRKSKPGAISPDDWKQLAMAVNAAANWHCRVPCPEGRPEGPRRCGAAHEPGTRHETSVHHLAMDPANCAWWNLIPDAMPCLTVRQPWALMLAFGVKQFETRSWATTYRGPIALHAAKGITADEVECCRDWPFRDALLAAGIKVARDLPRGAVIATATLVDCIRITPAFLQTLGEEEERMGDFTTGRYAWQFTDMWRLPEPIPAIGHLGLWQWMPPQCPSAAQKAATTR